MSFRKRNVVLGSTNSSSISTVRNIIASPTSGVRPSPTDGRPTTSTGTQTLDDLLGGHAGFPLGNSILIEENGTTDFSGALLRFYAAEGIVQGHQVHVVGVGEGWGRELPGLTGLSTKERGGEQAGAEKEKMKIAWRYERLGEFGAGKENSRPSPAPNRTPSTPSPQPNHPSSTSPAPFIHTFDLTKRLSPSPASLPINYISLSQHQNPYPLILASLKASLDKTPPSTVHRLLIPTLLSPALYPPTTSCDPTLLLPFLHSLRALLHSPENCTRLTAMLTLPLSLYPRSHSLTYWIEILVDGVIELSPFPHSIDLSDLSSGPASANGKSSSSSSNKAAEETKAQGMLKVRKLPVVTEKGQGLASAAVEGAGDLAFVLTRRRFLIRPFWLPPVEGEESSGGGGGGEGKEGLEF